jgi:hypothetical protein
MASAYLPLHIEGKASAVPGLGRVLIQPDGLLRALERLIITALFNGSKAWAIAGAGIVRIEPYGLFKADDSLIRPVPIIIGLQFQTRSNDPGSIHISLSSLFYQLYKLQNDFSMNSRQILLSKIEFWGNIYIFSPQRQLIELMCSSGNMYAHRWPV